MRFSTRLILTVGLSTLVLASLYWLVGWHYIEQVEAQQNEALQEFIGQRADLVLTGQVPVEALQLVPGVKLYQGEAPRPAFLQGMGDPGVYELGSQGTLMVRVQPDTGEQYALYLPLLERLVEPAESETVEALVAVGGVLLFTLGAMGLTLLLIWKQTLPVRQLMKAVADVTPEAPRLQPLPRTDELGELSRQFSDLLARTQAFIQREQNFTRFASHELRTPLMSMRSSLELLLEMTDAETDSLQQRALGRIARALERMELLTDSFLWLSRENRAGYAQVNRDALEKMLDQLQLFTPPLAKTLKRVWQDDEWCWSIHPFALSVVLDNLLRNALDHGEGEIEISASSTGLKVSNALSSSATLSLAEGGDRDHFGYGLPIVEQLCDKAGAHFHSGVEGGRYLAEIRF